MLIALFNGLKNAVNITNVVDSLNEEEKRSEETQKSALSGMIDVALGEDAHTVQKEMDESKETPKTKESSENEETIKEKSALSGIMDVALGEDAHTVQKEMDESKETAKTTESSENEETKGNLKSFFLKNGATHVTFDDDSQQDSQHMWETANER